MKEDDNATQGTALRLWKLLWDVFTFRSFVFTQGYLCQRVKKVLSPRVVQEYTVGAPHYGGCAPKHACGRSPVHHLPYRCGEFTTLSTVSLVSFRLALNDLFRAFSFGR